MIKTLTISPFQGLCFVDLPLCSEGRYCEGRYCEGRYREGRYRLADVCRPFRAMQVSPEGASSANDGRSPSNMIKHKKWDNHS